MAVCRRTACSRSATTMAQRAMSNVDPLLSVVNGGFAAASLGHRSGVGDADWLSVCSIAP
jgi:hypothetical protein